MSGLPEPDDESKLVADDSLAHVYFWLARQLLEEPRPQPGTLGQAPLLMELGMAVEDLEPPEATWEALAAEYCRLLIGPRGHLPPFQSVWTAGRLEGNVAVSMRRYLQWVSVTPAAGFVDHLGTQLQVMGQLLLRSAEETDRERIAADFYESHLSWGAPLIEKLKARSTSRYFLAVWSLAEQFLLTESAHWQAVHIATTKEARMASDSKP